MPTYADDACLGKSTQSTNDDAEFETDAFVHTTQHIWIFERTAASTQHSQHRTTRAFATTGVLDAV